MTSIIIQFGIQLVKIYVGLVILLILLLLGFDVVIRMNPIPAPDISDNYLIDFSKLLGSDWEVSSSEPDMKGMEDTQEEYIALKGTIRRLTRNSQNRNIFIRYLVMRYTDEQIATERYEAQKIQLFADSFPGNPPVGPTFYWEDVNFPTINLSHTDTYRLACMEIYQSDPKIMVDVRCIIFLLSRNRIAYVDMWTMQHSVVYLSMDDMITILNAIDEKMGMTDR